MPVLVSAVLSCMPVSPWSVLADCGPETRRSWHRREVAPYSRGGPQRVRLCSCAPDGYGCLTDDLCLNDEGWRCLGDRGGNRARADWSPALLLCVSVSDGLCFCNMTVLFSFRGVKLSLQRHQSPPPRASNWDCPTSLRCLGQQATSRQRTCLKTGCLAC